MHTVVGVLRGGPSREHEVSLRTGAAMIAGLPEEKYAVRDIYIDKAGQWFDRGRVVSPEKVLRQVDVVLNGLHGEYGEDGQVQKLFERFGVPHVGSDSFASHLAMHKVMSKHKAQEAGLLVPRFYYAQRAEEAPEAVRMAMLTFMQPVVVKPVGWGSLVGVSVLSGYPYVLHAVEQLFSEGAQGVVIEEYIRGQVAVVGVVENLRGQRLYTPPPVEIIPSRGDFFSYDSQHVGDTKKICPGGFTRVESEELQRLAKVMHRALGLRHYSRSDFILTPRGIYYLESNTLPGLASGSLLTKALASVGVVFRDFLEHLVALA